jgi:superfamily I DNA and RNA helicase
VTPHCSPVLPTSDPDILPELLLDSDSFPSGIHEYLRALSDYWNRQNGKRKTLDSTVKKSLISLLISEIQSTTDTFSMASVDNSIINLTEQQAKVLNFARGNPRILLKGGAGTGKTFLAIEQARIKASEGLSVLIVCFNRLLADFLKKEIHNKSLAVRIDVATITSLEKQRSEGNGYDYLIVDEGQDLLSPNHIVVLNRFLKGGIRGDPSRKRKYRDLIR